MSTPAGRWSSRCSESTVLGVGWWMSISRLWVDLEVLARVLVLERRADHAVDVLLGGQRHGTRHRGAGARGGLDDLLGRRLDRRVAVGLQADAYLVLVDGCHQTSCSSQLNGRSPGSGAGPNGRIWCKNRGGAGRPAPPSKSLDD